LSNAKTDTETTMAALRAYEERLKWAGEYYLGPNQRAGILAAVTATIEFLGATNLNGLEGPFLKLVHALNDLNAGAVPPLFRITDRGPGRPHPSENQTLAGVAGCAMQVLMELKYPKKEAGKLVAKKLQSLGISIGAAHNMSAEHAAKTIAYWRDTAKKGNPAEDDDARAYYGLLPDFRLRVTARIETGDHRDRIRQEFLNGLESVCRLMGFPNPTGAEIE
jgi:hypothetical protein